MRTVPSLSIAHRQAAGAAGPTVTVDPHQVRVADGQIVQVTVELLSDPVRLKPVAVAGVAHFFRLADATIIPLPPEDEASRHRLIAWQMPRVQPDGADAPVCLTLSPGDAYIAVVAGPADSPAIARFLHLRDYFNAERLADALSGHLGELNPVPSTPFALLVIEAR